MEEKKNKNINSPIRRKEFLQMCGSVIAGGAVLAAGAKLATKTKGKQSDVFWQIDPARCTQCGRCETDCVLPVSAVSVSTQIGYAVIVICAEVITVQT